MKKSTKLAGVLLSSLIVLSSTACKKGSKTTRATKTRETSDISESSSETEKTTEDTTDDTMVSSESSDSETSEEVITAAPTEPIDLNLKIDVPEKGCPIEFPEEDRYHYVMKLSLDPDKRTIGGHVSLTFFNDSEEDWDKLCLRDYSSLFIDGKTAGYDPGVTTNGATTEITNLVDERDNSTLDLSRDKDVSVVWIPLSKKLAPKEEMTLSYDFVAVIPTVADRYGVQDGVFNVTNFYPILAEYTKDGWSHEAFYNLGECFFSEIADYEVMLSLPETMKMVSTGLSTGAIEDNGRKIYKIEAPCVRDFVFCACESFEFLTDNYDGVHIHVVYSTEGEDLDYLKLLAEKSMHAAKVSLQSFGEAFGKYPYEILSVVLAPIDAGGMEYPNLVIIECNKPEWIRDDAELASYAEYNARAVVSHEIGHQWFMGIVGSNSGMEPWLDESFASFTECVYAMYGVKDGAKYYSRSYGRQQANLLDPNVRSPYKDSLPINRSYYAFTSQGAYLDAVYGVGQFTLFQIGEIIGMEELYGVIREYVHRNAFTNSTEDRFFEVLYEAVGTENQELNELIKLIFDREPPKS